MRIVMTVPAQILLLRINCNGRYQNLNWQETIKAEFSTRRVRNSSAGVASDLAILRYAAFGLDPLSRRVEWIFDPHVWFYVIIHARPEGLAVVARRSHLCGNNLNTGHYVYLLNHFFPYLLCLLVPVTATIFVPLPVTLTFPRSYKISTNDFVFIFSPTF